MFKFDKKTNYVIKSRLLFNFLKTRIRKLKNNNRKITVKNGIKKHGKGHSLCTKNRNGHFAL
jgi:hypothetical protein